MNAQGPIKRLGTRDSSRVNTGIISHLDRGKADLYRIHSDLHAWISPGSLGFPKSLKHPSL